MEFQVNQYIYIENEQKEVKIDRIVIFPNNTRYIVVLNRETPQAIKQNSFNKINQVTFTLKSNHTIVNDNVNGYIQVMESIEDANYTKFMDQPKSKKLNLKDEKVDLLLSSMIYIVNYSDEMYIADLTTSAKVKSNISFDLLLIVAIVCGSLFGLFFLAGIFIAIRSKMNEIKKKKRKEERKRYSVNLDCNF